jgi:hypothetical protein
MMTLKQNIFGSAAPKNPHLNPAPNSSIISRARPRARAGQFDGLSANSRIESARYSTPTVTRPASAATEQPTVPRPTKIKIRIMSASRFPRRSKLSTSLKSAMHRARRIDFAAVK